MWAMLLLYRTVQSRIAGVQIMQATPELRNITELVRETLDPGTVKLGHAVTEPKIADRVDSKSVPSLFVLIRFIHICVSV